MSKITAQKQLGNVKVTLFEDGVMHLDSKTVTEPIQMTKLMLEKALEMYNFKYGLKQDTVQALYHEDFK